MRRGYLAFVWGVPNRQRGTVDAPIDRHPFAREKMAVREGGREAVTHWEIREVFNGRDGKPVASLLACQLETGRTHQIRVHLASVGRPIVGDPLYGRKTLPEHLPAPWRTALAEVRRPLLHAWKLGFRHPADGRRLTFVAPPPEDFRSFAGAVR